MSNGGYLGDANVQRLLRAQTREIENRDAEDLRQVLSTEAGRRWYRRAIFDAQMCRLQLPTFDPDIREGQAAAMHQTYVDGMRRVGLQLLTEAQTKCPDLWLLLVDEGIAQDHADRSKRDEALSAQNEA